MPHIYIAPQAIRYNSAVMFPSLLGRGLWYHIISLMMWAKMVIETSVSFNHLTWLIA
jgi:hypothetical protein